MKFPDRIIIGPCTFTIGFVDKLLDDDGSTKLNGHIKYGDATIDIESNLSDQTQALTLMHEIIHGCDTFSCAELTEKQVELMSNQLLAVLVNNPDFVAMFKGATC